MEALWSLHQLVAEATARLAALPPPKNGQVRAVPDERMIRYYATLGLLDRPAAMRGRTALYSARHLAQVVAIKRMQTAGKSLAEIQALWLTLDDETLGRMSGVPLPTRARRPASDTKPATSISARREFWKGEAPVAALSPPPPRSAGGFAYAVPPQAMKMSPRTEQAAGDGAELRIEIAPGAYLTVGVADGVSISGAEIRALRAAAAPLVAELANRGLITPASGRMEEP